MNKVFLSGYIKDIQPPKEDGEIKYRVILKARHMNGGKYYYNTLSCFAYSALASLISKHVGKDDYVSFIGYLENNGITQYAILIEIETVWENYQNVDGNK